MTDYYVGQLVRLTCTFTVSSAATDPTTITLTVRSPSGTSTDYTYAGAAVTKSGTGIYYKDVSPTEKGTYYYRWAGTGTCQATTEGSFSAITSF